MQQERVSLSTTINTAYTHMYASWHTECMNPILIYNLETLRMLFVRICLKLKLPRPVLGKAGKSTLLPMHGHQITYRPQHPAGSILLDSYTIIQRLYMGEQICQNLNKHLVKEVNIAIACHQHDQIHHDH